jgi:hypothetical protein
MDGIVVIAGMVTTMIPVQRVVFLSLPLLWVRNIHSQKK